MASKVGQYFTWKELISEEFWLYKDVSPRTVIVYKEIKPFQVKCWHFAGHWVCNLISLWHFIFQKSGNIFYFLIIWEKYRAIFLLFFNKFGTIKCHYEIKLKLNAQQSVNISLGKAWFPCKLWLSSDWHPCTVKITLKSILSKWNIVLLYWPLRI